MILPNSDCTKLAVANEGEGEYGSSLVDPEGSVMIFQSADWSNPSSASKSTVALSGYTDSELMGMGVCPRLSSANRCNFVLHVLEARVSCSRGTCRCLWMPWCPSPALRQLRFNMPQPLQALAIDPAPNPKQSF